MRKSVWAATKKDTQITNNQFGFMLELDYISNLLATMCDGAVADR